MTEQASGHRTFFHHRGANALWNGAGLDFKKTRARIFHLGYLLLLDAMDAPHPTCGTKAAALLRQAQAAGLKTSVDVVSEDSDRFAAIVRPALRHTDDRRLRGRRLPFAPDRHGRSQVLAGSSEAGAPIRPAARNPTLGLRLRPERKIC
jgi:hypothetical protein